MVSQIEHQSGKNLAQHLIISYQGLELRLFFYN